MITILGLIAAIFGLRCAIPVLDLAVRIARVVTPGDITTALHIMLAAVLLALAGAVLLIVRELSGWHAVRRAS
jgi:hypothetical protein